MNVPEPRTTLYSVYITLPKGHVWGEKKIDHYITKLVCNIADTALPPGEPARKTIMIIREMVGKSVNSSRPTGGA